MFVLQRIGQAIIVVWAAYTLTFLLIEIVPSDPVSILLANPDSGLTEEAADQLRAYYGIDQPLLVRYFSQLLAIATGDLGISISKGVPVGSLLLTALPQTLVLAVLSLVLAVVASALVAVLAVYLPSSRLRAVIAAIPPFLSSIPSFLVGVLIIQYFAFAVRLIPPVDDGSLLALLGPAVTLAIAITPSLAQVLIASLEQTDRQPFIDVVRAKGASRWLVLRRHVLRNAILPWVTILGLTFGELLAGSIITETVFSRGGLGRTIEAAVASQDMPVIQGSVLIVAALFVIINLSVDLSYPLLDPRIRLHRTARAVRARSTAALPGELVGVTR